MILVMPWKLMQAQCPRSDYTTPKMTRSIELPSATSAVPIKPLEVEAAFPHSITQECVAVSQDENIAFA